MYKLSITKVVGAKIVQLQYKRFSITFVVQYVLTQLYVELSLYMQTY